MDIFGNFSHLKGDRNKRLVEQEEELDFSYSDTILETVEKLEDKDTPTYLVSLKFILALIFLALASKLFYLQVVKGADNQKLAEGNRIRPRVIEAPRGLVVDKDGVWLARNKPNYTLALYPSDLPKKQQEREDVIQKISNVSEVSADDIKDAVAKGGTSPFDAVVVRDNLTHDDALLYEEKIADIPGAAVTLRSKREYVTMPGLGHIVGYTAKVSASDIEKNQDYYLLDRIGKTGLESEYEKYLRGAHGIEQVEVDSKGNVVRVLTKAGSTDPIPGDDVTLYLDRGLQEKSAEALKAGIENAKQMTGDQDINSGVVAVMDVNTGGILSMVSLPDYDNNLFSASISNADYQKLANDKSQPLFNRATKGMYPPGSISKIILASAGLAEGNITTRTSFNTPPEIKIGEYVFPDWKDHSYESTNVERAIAESNNIFFYSIGGGYDKIKGLGIETINKYWRLFGLGEETGIDLPGEESGFLPTADWKKKAKGEPWYIGDTYHVSIGQGDLLVTPLQMLRATATIANGGKLLKPQMVKKITDHDGVTVKEFGPNIERENFIGSGAIEAVQRGMRQTITDGSARNLGDLPIPVAGKTGTAQFLGNQKTHAWFEAYAPYDNPQIAIIVLIDGGGGGHEIAAPVAKDILNYFFTR